MRKSIEHHAPGRHLLKPIATNRARRANRFVGITWLE
jgi:hypothetical protein